MRHRSFDSSFGRWLKPAVRCDHGMGRVSHNRGRESESKGFLPFLGIESIDAGRCWPRGGFHVYAGVGTPAPGTRTTPMVMGSPPYRGVEAAEWVG